MIVQAKLALAFDPTGLRDDLAALGPDDWSPHYNDGDFEGRWVGVPLRAVAGSALPLYADPTTDAAFVEMPVLDRLPHIRAALAAFRCPLRAARILSLGPGSRIFEHRDPGLGLDSGEARIHVPIRTNPDVEFVLDNRRVVLNAGETWYLDLSLPHRVRNRGATDRVHLVVDCVANDWLLSLFPEGADAEPDDGPAPPIVAEGPGAFERFREVVLADPDLQRRLDESTDAEAFARFVAREGRARGYVFAAEEVTAAIHTGRRAWIERHLR